MELELEEQLKRKRPSIVFLELLVGILLLYAALLNPLSLKVSSDVLWNGSVLSLLLDALMSVFNYLFYWLSFAFLLYFAATITLKNSAVLWVVNGVCILLRYVGNLLGAYFTLGFPTFASFVEDDLFDLILNIGLDFALFGAAWLIVLSFLRKEQESALIAYRLALLKNKEEKDKLPCYLPRKEVFEIRNPFDKALLLLAILPALIQTVGRIIFDCHYGAPTDMSDLLWMVAYYFSDVLMALVGFLVMHLILNTLNKRNDQ